MSLNLDPSAEGDHATSESNGNSASAGKWVIVAMLVAGLGASLAAWLFYRHLQSRPKQLWGPNAALILLAPEVELIVLDSTIASTHAPPPGEATSPDEAAAGHLSAATDDALEIDGDLLPIVERIRVVDRRGFTHVRSSLVNDRSFAWNAPQVDCAAAFSHVLRFYDPQQNQQLQIAFAFNCARVQLVGDPNRRASIEPVSKEIQSMFAGYERAATASRVQD